MPSPIASRLGALTGEIQALAAGTWNLFQQEMAGKATLTRRQILLMSAGALTALTAILLVLSGITLLLSQLLVTQAGWPPLTAGGISALIIASVFAFTGWLVFRNSRARLKAEGLKPSQTLHALKLTAAALTNQPLIPTPTPTSTPMNAQHLQDDLNQTADAVEYQARRTGRAVQDTAQSIHQKFDPGSFFASALAWVDAILTPQNRALAGKALAAAASLPRRHPAAATILGLGGLYLLWDRSREKSIRRTLEDYVSEVSGYANDLRRTVIKSGQATSKAGCDIRDTLYDTAHRFTDTSRNAAEQFGNTATHTAERVREACRDARNSVHDGLDQLAETAQQLHHDAEAGYRKAKEFAREKPAIAVAGGVALAIGALLLVKSSRK